MSPALSVPAACAGTCVTSLQDLLADKGHSPGTIDDDFGLATLSAIKSFQSSRGLTVRLACAHPGTL